ARARGRAGGAHHGAVAAALGRGFVVEARLLQHRAPVARGDRTPPRRVRPREGKGARRARTTASGGIGGRTIPSTASPSPSPPRPTLEASAGPGRSRAPGGRIRRPPRANI